MRKLSFLVALLAMLLPAVMACSPANGKASTPVGSPTLATGFVTATTEATATAQPTRSSSPSPTSIPTPAPTATPTPVPAPTRTGSAPAPDVVGRSVIVMDEQSGAVLFERNSHESLPPASITKIATALVAIEKGRLGDRVKVDYDATGLEDSTLMGVNPGDQVTLEDLLYGLMLPSGNEAAVAIGNHIAGSEKRFVDMMNAKVAELGLKDTHFVNPHGLDTPGHYTSAYDITMLARYGMMHYPEFRRLAAARRWEIHGRNPDGTPKDWEIYNLNRLLSNYDGADGVKIGYDVLAGRTIVGSATKNGHRVYVTALNCGDTVLDTKPLLDWAFKNFTWQ